MAEERVRVLLLDDEESLRVPLEKFLEDNFSYHVDPVASGEEALEQVEKAQGRYDVALIDEVLLRQPDGIEVMQQIKGRYPDIECIVFTGWRTESRQRALQAGAFRYLEKPFDTDVLAMLIRTAAQQVRLREIGRAILSERDLDQVLEGILRAACSLALADEAAIVLLERATGIMRVHAKTHPGEPEWKKHFKDQDLSREIIRTGEVVRVSDTAQDARVDEKVCEAGIRCFLGVPIHGKGGNLGVLYAYSRRPQRFEEGATVAVLQTLASQAGLAIANIRAFGQIRAHAGYMEALVRAGQGLIQTTELEQQLILVWDFVREQLKVSTFFVALYDKQADTLRFPLHYDEGQPVKITDRPLGDDPRRWGLAGYVVKTGRELYWPTREEGRVQCEALGIEPVCIGKPCQSCFFLPLKMGDGVVGVISIQSYNRYTFSPIVRDACRALGSQLSVALENVRRMQELEQMRQAAEAMSRVFEPRQALQQIVESAARVLQADSAAIWSYDEVRRVFIPEELVAVGIPPDELQRFREEEPKPGRTADTVMREGYVAVRDISLPEYSFLGQPTRDLLDRIGVRSFQGIALRVGDERVGVLYANYKRLRTFGEDEGAKLRTFAGHAALALKNARLLAQIQRTKEAAGVIAGVTVQEKLEQTLKTIAEHTQRVLRSDAVALYSYDEATGQLGERAAEILDPRHPDSARPPGELRPDSVIWSILNLAGPPYYCLAEDRAAEDILLGGRFVRDEEIQAAIGVQLRVGERKVGVMFVDFRSPHRFTSDEIATIQLFADQAAVAIRNTQLYRGMQALYGGLLRMGEAVVEAGKFYPVALQVVADTVKGTLGCDIVSLYAYYEKQNEVTYPSVIAGELIEPQKQADWEEARLSKRLNLDIAHREAVLRQLLLKHESVYASDVSKEPILGHSRFATRERIKSSAAISLRAGAQIVGIMFVNYRSPHIFTKEEEEMLELFATQAAIAIQNAQQYEELKRDKGLIGARTALAWMGMASSAWRHAIDKHALTIREQAQLLRADLSKVLAHEQHIKVTERLAMMERLANQILEKPIVPPLSREEGVEPVVINELIGERARQLSQNDPYRATKLRLDLQLPGAATVRASPEWLRRAFDILVDNAVEAVADREVREIAIGTRAAGGGAEIWVSDTGPGIPEEIRAKIGLEPIEKPEDAKGLGMGLLMVQTIVQTYGGELRVASTGPTGTTMVIWLPLEG